MTEDNEKRKHGRPSSYTPALATEICERLAAGESLLSICRSEHMPSDASVRRWVIEDIQSFSSEYARARDLGLEHCAEEIIAIADDRSDDPKSRQVRLDARKWYLSKIAPKRYGDRLELAGDPEAPVAAFVIPALPAVIQQHQERKRIEAAQEAEDD